MSAMKSLNKKSLQSVAVRMLVGNEVALVAVADAQGVRALRVHFCVHEVDVVLRFGT